MATRLKNYSVIPTKIIFDRYGNCAVPSSIFDEFGIYCEKIWPSFQLSPVLQMK